jgi:hypothetical protein
MGLLEKLEDKLDALRKTLGTRSLREWIKKDLVLRTKLALNHIPGVFYHAYTVAPIYTVRLYNPDTGDVSERGMTELEIVEQYGELAWEEALRQFEVAEDVYIDLNDVDSLWGPADPQEWQDLRWGDWNSFGEADE